MEIDVHISKFLYNSRLLQGVALLPITDDKMLNKKDIFSR